MTAPFIFKGFIVLLLLFIFVSLGSALVFLVRDKGSTDRTVKSLTVRVVLSFVLLLLLVLGAALGLIHPHGILPTP